MPTYLDGVNEEIADLIDIDTSGEFTALTEKVALVSADVILIEDSEAGYAKKYGQLGNLPGVGYSTFLSLTDTPSNFGVDGAIYVANNSSGQVDESSVILAEGTNTFSLTKGTASLDIAAGTALDIDANLTVNNAIVLGGTNGGTIDFGAASKTLTISETCTIDQDLQQSSGPTFAGVNLSSNAVFTSGAYLEFADVASPAAPGSGKGRLYKKSSDDGLWWRPDDAIEADLTVFTGLKDTPSYYAADGAIYVANSSSGQVDESSVILTEGTNTFTVTKGTASLDVDPGAALTVSSTCTIDQDLQQSAGPTFTGLNINANIVFGVGGFIEFLDMSAPLNPGDGRGRLYKKTSDDGLYWLPDSAGSEIDLTSYVDAHKDTHDPEDGTDALDTAAAALIAGVQDAGVGTSHSFARADHVHQIQHSIADNALVTVDGAPNDDEYAKWTADGLEGRTYAEVRSDLNVEDGADVTDSTNVDAAGAVMEADYDANTILKADSDNTPATLTVAEQRIIGRITSGSIDALTAAQVRTLLNVSDGASSTFLGLTDTPGAFAVDGAIYVASNTSGQVDESSVILTEGTNTFALTKGTASLDIAVGATLNIDQNLTVSTACVLDQDLQQSASPSFSALTLANNITLTDGGSVVTTNNSNIVLLPNGSGITVIGDAGSTSHTLNTNDSLFVSGMFEADGAAYFDSTVTIGGAVPISAIIDDDTMVTAADTKLATSECIKAYIDNGAATAAGTSIAELGTATYDDVQDFINITQSATAITGLTVTDGGSGTVDISAGKLYIKTTDSDIGQNVSYDFAGTTGLSLTNNSANYIYIDYNSGSPIAAATTLLSGINLTTEVMIARVYRIGTDLSIVNVGQRFADYQAKNCLRDFEVDNFVRANGEIVGETGTRHVTVTAGVGYISHNRITTSAIDTTGPLNCTCYATYTSSIDLTFAEGSTTGTAAGGASVSGGKLDLTGGTLQHVKYGNAGNADLVQTGTIRITYIPAYSGSPSNDQYLVTLSEGTTLNNFLQVRHNTSGQLAINIFDSTGSSIVSTDVASFSPTASTGYEIELNFDVTTGATRLFVDGTQVGSTYTNTGTRSSTLDKIVVGGSRWEGGLPDFEVDSFGLFDAVKHTTNYTPADEFPDSQDFSVWNSSASTSPDDTGIKQVDNANYWNGSALTSLTSNRYGTRFFYRAMDGTLHMQYGTSNESSTDAALEEDIPAPPDFLDSFAMYIGRIVIQEGASTFFAITTPFAIYEAVN